MEQVRNVRLDHLCESIGESRDAMNLARTDEQEAIQTALTLMHDQGVNVYKHATIELARVPGAEKLRVRIVKEQGNAEIGGGAEASDDNADAPDVDAEDADA